MLRPATAEEVAATVALLSRPAGTTGWALAAAPDVDGNWPSLGDLADPAVWAPVSARVSARLGGAEKRVADSLLLIVDAIKEAKSTDPKAIEGALKKMKFTGVRGTFQFSDKPGYSFQQWVDIPYVAFQLTEVNQPVSKSNLVQAPGQPLAVSKLQRPK